MKIASARAARGHSSSFERVPAGPPDLIVAREVLATEAAALHALGTALDGCFVAAVDLLAAVAGRIVCLEWANPAMSGERSPPRSHPLAARRSSSTRPRPSHGDLGMVVPGDAVLALSNSGETAELADLVAHARRFAIPLLAVTARPSSTLAQAADVVLTLPAAAEACPMGLAPTSSTTMQMALGDALAVALLTRRGFSPADFRDFHPAGTLGQRLRRVRDLMHAGDAVPLVAPRIRMAEAILTMTDKRFGCVGVVDEDGRLIGIVTDGDLRRAMAPTVLERPVAELMTASPRRIGPDALAGEALRAMNGPPRPITTLFVVDPAERPLGILHVHDLLRAGTA